MCNTSKVTCAECGFNEYINFLSFPANIPSGKEWHKHIEKNKVLYFCSSKCLKKYKLKKESDWDDTLDSYLDYYLGDGDD